MRPLARLIAVIAGTAALAGCCASPYRIWQNGWGFNNPVPDTFNRYGPPAPRTTPPGYTTSAETPYLSN